MHFCASPAGRHPKRVRPPADQHPTTGKTIGTKILCTSHEIVSAPCIDKDEYNSGRRRLALQRLSIDRQGKRSLQWDSLMESGVLPRMLSAAIHHPSKHSSGCASDSSGKGTLDDGLGACSGHSPGVGTSSDAVWVRGILGKYHGAYRACPYSKHMFVLRLSARARSDGGEHSSRAPRT